MECTEDNKPSNTKSCESTAKANKDTVTLDRLDTENEFAETQQLSESSIISDSHQTHNSVTVVMAPNLDENKEPAVAAQNNDDDNTKHKKHHRKEKPKDEVTFRTHLTSLAHASVLVFVYLILKLAFRGEFVFFTWHPILMSVGWMLLMTEGLFAINKYNTYWRFKTKGGFRVKIHVIILSLGYILSLAGFAIVYINKNLDNKSHFVSWHGLFGLIGIISTFPPIVNGFVLWYKKELSNYVPNSRLIKFVHVSSGTLAFAFGALSLLLSVYTRWYGKKSEHSSYLFYLGLLSVSFPLFWAVYGPSVKLARVIRDYFKDDKEE